VAGKTNKKFLVSWCLRGRAFTLIELVVAIALLALVISFAGIIFKEGIGSYRIATAQSEIMQKLRAITGQLDSDFKGLRKDAPLFLWFHKGPIGTNDPNRFDQLMFFADGDFQSTRLYDGTPDNIPSDTGSPIVSNLARIQYGQAMVYSPTDATYLGPWAQQAENNLERIRNFNHRTLARRQHLLTDADDIIEWPVYSNFAGTFAAIGNGTFEHDSLSLSQWQAVTTTPANNDQIITVCLINRPQIDFKNSTGLHVLMTEGVGNMSIQWAYSPGPGIFYWWPSIDADGNPLTADSDFSVMGRDQFAICFNMAAPGPVFGLPPNLASGAYIANFPADFYPTALKFTFTLYDSRGVFKDGQTFTHIVYIGD